MSRWKVLLLVVVYDRLQLDTVPLFQYRFWCYLFTMYVIFPSLLHSPCPQGEERASIADECNC